MALDGFKYGVMLGYMEVFGVTICTFVERKYIRQEVGRVAPISAYSSLTLCLISSSALSNMSLNFINFPTKVIFRSCKLIPTMVISTVINRHVFNVGEYASAAAVCLGLVMFATGEWQHSPSFDPTGLLLVSLSVVADSILPNAQERMFKSGSSRLEVTLYTNVFTLIAMTITTLLTGDLIGMIRYGTENHILWAYMGVYTFVAYIAISMFMRVVKGYGGVVAVLLGTLRKGLTLVLSFVIFPKAFSWMFVFGSILVLGGLATSSLLKQHTKQKKLPHKYSDLQLEEVTSTRNGPR